MLYQISRRIGVRHLCLASRSALVVTAFDDYGGVFETSQAADLLRKSKYISEVRCERTALRGEALVESLRKCDVALFTQQRTKLNKEIIEQCPELRWVLNTGRNAGHLDLEALETHGTEVLLRGGSNPASPAELTWALILASYRNIVQENQSIRSGGWQSCPAGIQLQGKTLGIFGLGNIGVRVANVGSAFGMNVLTYGQHKSALTATSLGYNIAKSKEDLFLQSDVLSVHLKSNSATNGIIKKEDLILMKPSALFVNTSRAELVEKGALVDCLQRGQPGFAALDVFEEEPISYDNPLFKLDNVLATPHIGYVTEGLLSYYEQLVQAFLDEIDKNNV